MILCTVEMGGNGAPGGPDEGGADLGRAAEVQTRLAAVAARQKNKQLPPGAAVEVLGELREALERMDDTFSTGQLSDAYSILESSLNRVYDDCGGDVQASLACMVEMAEAYAGDKVAATFTRNQKVRRPPRP